MPRETFTFWLGLTASGAENAYCICGDELDRTEQLAVHVHDGTRLRAVCYQCAQQYAPHLAMHLPRRLREAGITRLPTIPKAPAKFALIDLVEVEPLAEDVKFEKVETVVEDVEIETVEWVPVSDVAPK